MQKTKVMKYKSHIIIVYTLLGFCIASFIACNKITKVEQTQTTDSNVAHLEINNPRYSFGVIHKSGQKHILCPFKLKNTGTKHLVIQKIDVSCNCISILEYPKTIAPSETKNLYIQINAEKQLGYFNKVVFLNSNADNALELLRIKGEIKE